MNGSDDLPKKVSYQCAICGDEAFGRNLGAICCESCKSFFRRHCARNAFRCPSSNHCKINKITRKYCPACRMAKCYSAGMRLPGEDRVQAIDAVPSTLGAVVKKATTFSIGIKTAVSSEYTQAKITSLITNMNVLEVTTSQVATLANPKDRGRKQMKLELSDAQYQSTYDLLLDASKQMSADYLLYLDQQRKKQIDVTRSFDIVEVMMLGEAIARRCVRVMKKIPQFQSLDKDLQMLLMRKNLLGQSALVSAFFVNVDASGWLIGEGESGKMKEFLFSDLADFYKAINMDSKPYTHLLMTFVRFLRTEFPQDWQLVSLVLCVVMLLSWPKNEQVRDANTEHSQRKELKERRSHLLAFLCSYFMRQYGNSGRRKFDLSMHLLQNDVRRVYEMQLYCLAPVFAIPVANSSSNANANVNSAHDSAPNANQKLSSLAMELMERGITLSLAPLLFELMAEVTPDATTAV